MSPQREELHKILSEVYRAESSLWFADGTSEGRQALRRAIDLLHYCDDRQLPQVQIELGNADALLLGRPKASTALQCIRSASLHLWTLLNERPHSVDFERTA